MHCTPTMLLRVLDAFGDAPVVAAHFGGYLLWKEVYDVLCGTDIYLDTAFHRANASAIRKRIIDKHSPDRILFGSDMPWSSSVNEVNFIKMSWIKCSG